MRTEVVATLKQNTATHPYPHKFAVDTTLVEFIDKYGRLEKGERLNDELVTVAGRVHDISNHSKKLIFYDLRGDDVKLQAVVNAKQYESIDVFKAETENIRRGDIIGITGIPTRTAAGELSIIPKSVRVSSIVTMCL